MKRLNSSFLALACAALLAATTVLSAQAGMEPPGPAGGRGAHGGPGLLHGVALSEAQQQKAFALRHAAEPQMFEQMGRVRRAHDTLRQLGEADRFDEARAGAAADALGHASAALALGRARLAAQMQALLTAEQRARQVPRGAGHPNNQPEE